MMPEQWNEMRRRHVQEVDDLIRSALQQMDGNKARASRLIGMPRRTMLRMIRDHGIEPGPPATTERG